MVARSVDTFTENMKTVNWCLDQRQLQLQGFRQSTDVACRKIEDLTLPMPILKITNLQPGDSMSFTYSTPGNEPKIAIGLPQSAMVEINILGGDDPFTMYSTPQWISTIIDFDANQKGPTHSIQFGGRIFRIKCQFTRHVFCSCHRQYRSRIEFQTTSLSNFVLIHFPINCILTVEDEIGMVSRPVLHWVFRRDGLDISGTKSSFDMKLGYTLMGCGFTRITSI